MKREIFIAILYFIISINSASSQGYDIKYFNVGWQFEYQDSAYKANVPGNIFFDLFINGIIPSPYFGDNEKKVQWVSNRNWEYFINFDIDAAFLNHDDISLSFDGLDTYAKVFLNGREIISANNMFRKWSVPVKSILKSHNKLKVLFYPPLVKDSVNAAAQSYKFPDSRAFSRKAPYQYGWDWGPKLVGEGIWKEVYLEANDGFLLRDVYIKQNSLDSNLAKLTAILDIENIDEDSISIEIYNNTTKETKILEDITLEKNRNILNFDFEIKNPKLWWPNGFGKPEMYEIIVNLHSKQKVISKGTKIGLRTIRLVQEPDKLGAEFYFEVNGIPVFAKGANYIPQDNFPSSVKEDRYRRIIKDVVKSNMNMLRVWGGGIYEKNKFYDLCDENGVMVWQDFMFACNFYPGNKKFMENVGREAKQQIVRLRNHPSIALWCGNNEIDEAWHNWGYQKSLEYTEQDSIEIWRNYKTLFHSLLPSLIDKFSPSTGYISTSPKIGWGHKEALLSGDMHYWGVWWGGEPFEIFKKKVGRFMSEYGFQSFPDMKTIRDFVEVKDLNLNSPALLNHQKHPRGMQLIKEYMSRDFPVPDKFDDYVYMSQLVQAYGMDIAIEAHRRARPYCMGTLYWQLNDSWPVISWASIDYFGRWKALQYHVKKSYKTVIISEDVKGDSIDIYTVSDSLSNISGTLINRIMDFGGKVISIDSIDVNLLAGESKNIVSYDIKSILNNVSLAEVFMHSVLESGGETIADKLIYFVKPKELKLKKPEITYNITKVDKGYRVTIKSNTLVKNLYLSSSCDGHFSDNYFDLLPDRVYTVLFSPKDICDKKMELKTKYLNEF